MIIPVPSEIAGAILDLREKYFSCEITEDEYNRRFHELQAQVDRDKTYPQTSLTWEEGDGRLGLSET